MFCLNINLVFFDMRSCNLKLFTFMVLKYDMLLNLELEYSNKTTMV